MSKCLMKLPHECGSQHGLQVFLNDDGSITGYCFACDTFIQNPLNKDEIKDIPKPIQKTDEEIKEEIKSILTYPTVEIPFKRLRKDSLDYFNVKIGLSEKDGKTPTVICYPYTKNKKLSGFKLKLLSKKIIWSVGDLKQVDPFGWEQAISSGAKRIIITEGEDDAIAWHRILELYAKEEWKDYTTVISLPHGAGNAKSFISSFYKNISEFFKDIYISFDMDEAGRKAVDEVCMMYPSIKSISLPEKDANKCVIEGKSKAAFNCLFKASSPKNSHIIFCEDIHQKARESAKFGELKWPWKHIQEATRGIRYGETIYIGAGVKMGKSELVNSLTASFIRDQDTKVFLVKPEEAVEQTYKLVCGKICGKIFHDPKIPMDYDAYDKAGKILQGKLSMVGVYQNIGWEFLKNDIMTSINFGSKAIFIDPITNLTTGMNAADANTKLEEITQELSVIAKDNNVVVFIFCHLKAPEGSISKEQRLKYYREGKYIGLGNCPHELGGDIYSTQFAGSRAMMRKCHMMIGLEGNKDPELDQEIRCIRHLKVLEDRSFNTTGIFPLYYNINTTQYKEYNNE